MELGKLDRSTYLACYFDDELLRRRVHTQLNAKKPATPWPGKSSTAKKANSGRNTKKARKIN
ncbi:Tn3 transposase DDE domain-containing protein [Nonomuraea solani]|uniref:Tn3 transposase DDE domain-containing protein n=1 Tax=Nonomuraea solani TaxID=1144553 RepID=A0A1H6EUS3_9ACTN|nr:Tn3 transposase DDE domain-containing protein [Nonomuraea solani]